MNIDHKNVIEHYPGVTLRFDRESKKIHYLDGGKKSLIFPNLTAVDDLTLNDLRSLIIEEDKLSILEKTAECIKMGEAWCFDYRVETQNKIMWLREQSYFTSEGQGDIYFVGLFIDDITEIKNEKQQYLKELNEASETANSKNEFFASMSHEIRTPMNAVMGMAQILEKTALDVEQHQYVNTIISSSNALVQIINDILDLSKLEAGKIEILEEEVDLESLCIEICHLLSARAQEKHLELYFNYQAPECKKVTVDKGRLRQILINLIGNAIKFTETGHVELLVEMQQDSNASRPMLQFSIRDTGIGISESAKQKLFKAYAQADSSISQRFGGTGLGLQICQRLVTLMGGAIGIKSDLGIGSNFWFKVPMNVIEQSQTIPSMGKTCLLIGDDPFNNKLLADITKKMGFQVQQATFSEVSSRLSSDDIFDYFIIDSGAEDFDNIAIATYIKKNAQYRNSRILILNHIGDQIDQISLFQSGVDMILSKPVSPSLIYRAIKLSSTEEGTQTRALYISHESNDQTENYSVKAAGKVLIAEDVEVNQVILNSMLTHIGLETEVANNGEEAYEKVKDGKYDLVFMDCRMPIMDGFESTRKIRANQNIDSNLPIVALTANAGEQDKQECLAAGMNDFLSKPYTEKDLVNVIGKWLELVTVDKAVVYNAVQDVQENAILDFTQFDSIKASLQEEFANFALDTTDKCINYQQEIIRYLKNADMDQVVEKAHSLMGMAAMIGARQVSDIAFAIEEASKVNDLETVITELSKLDKAISQTHSMIIIRLNPDIDKSLSLF